MRLDKYLCEAGIGTRSEVKKLISKKKVTVNDRCADDPGMHIAPGSDAVFADGKEITFKEHVYYMLNKPAGVITASKDRNDKTVLDFFPDVLKDRLEPVGRLDKDTEGLLLLTDDGALIHRLISPKYHVDKEYEVHIPEMLSEEAVKRIEEGLDIGDDKPTLPAKVKIPDRMCEPKCGAGAVINLIIHEGRFHQVKRMAEAVGSKVLYLKRLRMGSIVLDERLATGEYRELTQQEIDDLYEDSKGGKR